MGKKNIGSQKYDIVLNKLDKNTSHGKVLSQITPGSTVLECGCASGYMTKWMKENLDCHVSVIEIDGSCYEQARPYADDGYCGDLTEKGWSDYYAGKTFDYILFADVLEHLADPSEVLTRAVSFLEEDGKVIVSIPNIAHNDVILKLIDDRFDYTSTGLLDNTHVHFWGQKNLEAFFSESGLAITVMDGTIAPTGSTEQFKDFPSFFDQNILTDLGERPLGNIYQYVVTAQKRSYIMNHEAVFADLLPQHEGTSDNKVKPVTVCSSLYYAEERDFNAENSIVFANMLPERTTREIRLSVKIPGKYRQLRIDPCEGSFCQVSSIKVVYENEKLPIKGSNGFCVGNHYFFTDKDPQIYFDLPDSDKEKKLEIVFLLHLFGHDEEDDLKKLRSLVEYRASKTEPVLTSTVYFSDGSEYTEDNSTVFRNVLSENDVSPISLSFDIILPEGCKKIRIDPCEGYYCLLSDIQLICEGKKLKYTTPNGLIVEDILLFRTEDPQIELEIRTVPGAKLYVNMKIKLFDVRDLTLGIISDRFSSLESSNDEITQKHNALLSDLITAKETEISQLTASYEDKLSKVESAKETEISQLTASYDDRLSELEKTKDSIIKKMTEENQKLNSLLAETLNLCARKDDLLIRSQKDSLER